MHPITRLKTLKDRIKLRLMLDEVADLRFYEAKVDRTSEAWITLRQQRVYMQGQILMVASRLLPHGQDVSKPASYAEIYAAAGAALAVCVVALNAIIQFAKAIA